MSKKRRRFTAEFKKRVALEALRERDTVQSIAARHEVHPNQVSTWKRQAVEGLAEVFAGSPKAGFGARVDDSGPARQDRGVDGRAGFFSARVGALSREGRVAMIEHGGELSLARQCALLGVSRSSQYYAPSGESAENLALMRRMDELHLAASVLRQPADGAAPAPRGRGGGAAPDPAAEGADGTGGGVLPAADQRAEPGAPGVPVPAARPDDRPARTRCGARTSPTSLFRMAFSTWSR